MSVWIKHFFHFFIVMGKSSIKKGTFNFVQYYRRRYRVYHISEPPLLVTEISSVFGDRALSFSKTSDSNRSFLSYCKISYPKADFFYTLSVKILHDIALI